MNHLPILHAPFATITNRPSERIRVYRSERRFGQRFLFDSAANPAHRFIDPEHGNRPNVDSRNQGSL